MPRIGLTGPSGRAVSGNGYNITTYAQTCQSQTQDIVAFPLWHFFGSLSAQAFKAQKCPLWPVRPAGARLYSALKAEDPQHQRPQQHGGGQRDAQYPFSPFHPEPSPFAGLSSVHHIPAACQRPAAIPSCNLKKIFRILPSCFSALSAILIPVTKLRAIRPERTGLHR